MGNKDGNNDSFANSSELSMITSAQLRAARALLGIDQKKLAELAGLSVPTVQRMESREDMNRGNVDSLMKLIAALDAAGVEIIGEGSASLRGGRGVRLKGQAEAAPSPESNSDAARKS